ncbi:hypothetical protein [Moritella yayanosii]|uniref:Uncharacterized protein n=1 Tax=Moritella yayanosii TaxID=69539 RepID=A0A330LW42_9GAMM|nr:hypothetical protein [Moritella yayanosii]SQD78285.1 protein of unknown function [Moritella yayanosii]
MIVATLAVGIHIQMTNAGVSYPQWFDQPIWVPLSLFILQNMGILWLSERIKEWRTSLSFIGVAVSAAIVYLTRKQRSGTIYPAA